MQWLASIWAPVIYTFEFAPYIMNVRQAQRNHYHSEAATPENVTSSKFLAIYMM